MNYYIGLTLTGAITGILGGLIGGGAEIFIVPLLTIFGILGTIKNRIGTSLFMLLPPIGLFAAIKFYKKGNVDIFAALYMAVIFTVFSYFASIFTININPDILQKIFGVLTIIAGVYIIFSKSPLH